jgi:hypothetical protein
MKNAMTSRWNLASSGDIGEREVIILKTVSDTVDTAWLASGVAYVGSAVVKAAQSTLSKAPVLFIAEAAASVGYCLAYEYFHSAEYYANTAKQEELHPPKLTAEHTEL